MYVCVCNAVTDSQIRQAVEQGARSLRDLREGLGVGTCCGRCAPCASGLLRSEAARCAGRQMGCQGGDAALDGLAIQAA